MKKNLLNLNQHLRQLLVVKQPQFVVHVHLVVAADINNKKAKDVVVTNHQVAAAVVAVIVTEHVAAVAADDDVVRTMADNKTTPIIRTAVAVAVATAMQAIIKTHAMLMLPKPQQQPL
ncbi:MAG: hypothetical protein HWD59_12585 [Coxiellaceae bacterium]|nr:MAG: hypothetical protein HWD59_12585 [Coxiellaceae bacterium]